MKTVIDTYTLSGEFLGRSQTRTELQTAICMNVWPRSESGEWNVADPNAEDSLNGIDEVACGMAAKRTLVLRLI